MNRFKKIICMLLIFVLVTGTAEPAAAVMADTQTSGMLTLTDAQGNAVTVDESWEETFPYGTFAFENSALTLGEGEGGRHITVYRLGGTTGKATVEISLRPAISELQDGAYSVANAAGAADYKLQVEETLPAAAYQPYGREPQPLEPMMPVSVIRDEAASTEDTLDSSGEVAHYGDTVLKLAGWEDAASETTTPAALELAAASFQWQIFMNGEWTSIAGATEAALTVSNESRDSYDYRCIFEVNGTRYCSDSYGGIEYAVQAEVFEEMPADIDLNPEPSYYNLIMAEGVYDTYYFELTFAQGEWKKDFIVTPTEDSDSEAVELAAITMESCIGGSLYDTANTLLLSIEDNDAIQPSYVHFLETSITADKAADTATLTVKRTGGLQYVFTVDYETADGTAQAGADYEGTQGTLYFAADMDEMQIEIPLIDDGIIDETADQQFTVKLSNPQGGGADSAIETETATVSLYNSGIDNGVVNVESMLYNPDVIDATQSVPTVGTAVARKNGQKAAVEALQPNDDLLMAKMTKPSGDGLSLQSKWIKWLTFDRSVGYDDVNRNNDRFWRDYAYIANNNGTYSYMDINNVSGYMRNYWDKGGVYGSTGWHYYVEDNTGTSYARFTPGNFGLQFNHIYARLASDVSWGWAGTVHSTAGFGISGGSSRDLYYTSGDSLYSYNTAWFDKDIPSGSGGVYMKLGRSGDSLTQSPDGEVMLNDGAIRRKMLANNLQLVVHTADDAKIAQSVSADSFYTALVPGVGISSGGVSGSGRLYVGTTLQIDNPTSNVYTPALIDGKLDSAIYINKGAGSASVRNATGNRIQLIGGVSDEAAYYSLNVVLNRNQRIKLDITPSVPRNVVDGVIQETINPAMVEPTNTALWDYYEDNDKSITYTYRTVGTDTADHFKQLGTGTLTEGSFSRDNTMLTSSTTVQNLQSINFNLPPDDQILFDGQQYNGDADIPIPVAQMNMTDLTFVYYQKEYVSVKTSMTMAIGRVEQYIDSNNNGTLDGALDENNVFTPDGDTLVAQLSAQDYVLTKFSPVLDAAGNTLTQMFKVYYNMTPKCLSVPEGGKETDRAQILPIFTTSITDESLKATLTAELLGYRFITSGMHPYGSGIYTADNKLMYTADANGTETVDIPVGGDLTPPPPTYVYEDSAGVKTQSKVYDAAKKLVDIKYLRADWDPTYDGHLLYTYKNPEAIFVTDPLVGSMLPVSDQISGTNPPAYDVAGLNAYLGAFNADETLLLGVRQQGMTTGEIEEKYTDTGLVEASFIAMDTSYVDGLAIEMDTINPSGIGTIPDSGNTRSMTGANGTSNTGMNSADSSNSMDEFNTDLGFKLPSLSFGLSDYLTIIIDGYEIGFSIGVPVFKAERSTGNYSNSGDPSKAKYGEWEKKGPVDENKEQMSDIKKAFTNPSALIGNDDWNTAKKDSKAAYDKGDKLAKTKGQEISVAINVTIMFKYSIYDHAYKFSSAMVFLQFEYAYKYTVRLTVCPIVYAYFVVGITLEAAGGIKVDREVVENTTTLKDLMFNEDGSSAITGVAAEQLGKWSMVTDAAAAGGKAAQGDPGAAFTTTVTDAFNIYFNGTLLIEADGGSGYESLGYVKSDGGDPVTIMLDDKVDGDGSFDVRIRVLDGPAVVDKLVPIARVASDTYFTGISLTPGLYMEVGAGVGVECLKIEVYFKANINCTFSFWARDSSGATNGSQLRDPSSSSLETLADDADVEDFSFDSMVFRAGLGVRVTALIFSFELDVIQFGINYTKAYNMDDFPEDAEDGSEEGYHSNGWKFAWYALNGSETLASYDLDDVDEEEGFPGLRITMPANTFWAQAIYGPENARMVIDELDELAYDPGNMGDDPEFQISGYSESGDAFRLATGLATGTDYQLLTVGEDNYMIYTLGRENPASGIDANMLVLSKVVNTGAQVGLVNPVDPSSGVDYIVVDRSESGVADATGDLDFAAWSESGSIHAAWISYATDCSQIQQTTTDAALQLKLAAQNTVVKTAAFEIGSDGFTPAVLVSGMTLDDSGNPVPKTGSYVFLPEMIGSGDLIFFARTNPYDESGLTGENEDLRSYYEATRGTSEALNERIDTGEGDPTAAFRYAYGKSMNDVYGNNTDFCFAVKQTDGSYESFYATPEGWTQSGMRLDHVAMTAAKDALGKDIFYLAYTASRTETEVLGTDYADKTVHKLYLQKGTFDSTTTGALTVHLEDAAVLRMLVDITDKGGASQMIDGLIPIAGAASETHTQDGVYTFVEDGIYQQTTELEDPYFGNLKFLNGALGNLSGNPESFEEELGFSEIAPLSLTDPALFMLFEMNGTTYVIPQTSLASITDETARDRTGVVIPFFEATDENGTKGNVTIGADGDGNIAAVYTDTVPNTTNNAIYVSKYDPLTTSWGLGRMLAMNYMQVYEDSIAGSWDPDRTEAAYYDPAAGGGLTSFVFSNLEIALGIEKTTDPETAAAGAGESAALLALDQNVQIGVDQRVEAEAPLVLMAEPTDPEPAVDQSTLLILAQGTQTQLKQEAFWGGGSDSLIVPRYDEDGRLLSSTGYYAISFGVGEKNVGEGAIQFYKQDFTEGARLLPIISFKNTGDVPIRGSETEPILLKLMLSAQPAEGGVPDPAGALELAAWQIKGNILVGEQFTTADSGVDLYTEALPPGLEGRVFFYTVDEFSGYAESPLHYDSLTDEGGTTVTILDKTELAIEEMTIETTGTDGEEVILAVDLLVTNRGTKDSLESYLQFAYQSGVDETDNEPIYSALDIRSNTLAVDAQQEIAAQAVSTQEALAQGILNLYSGADGSSEIRAGYGRRVHGTIRLPKSAYCEESVTRSLNLKVEVYDGAATLQSMDASGLKTFSFDNEWQGSNNSRFIQLEAESYFTTPERIAIPLGTTLKLYLPITTTRDTAPMIFVSELNSRAQETRKTYLGELYYQTGTDQNGNPYAYLIITPSEEGCGVIRLADTATTDFSDIAFTVTEAGSGINIFNDNDIFTWYDENGGEVDVASDTLGIWTFLENVKAWGPETSFSEPYLNDLSRSSSGRRFSFTSLSESIDLYFDGWVRVSSTFPGFAAKTIEAYGGGDELNNHANVFFGENPTNYPHRITVEILSDQASFDKVIEHYSQTEIVLPYEDTTPPRIYWSRQMPAAGSLSSAAYADAGYPITVYIVDEGILASTLLETGTSDARDSGYIRHSDGFAQFDITLKHNGTFTVIAADNSGNVTTRGITADWFNTGNVTDPDETIRFTDETGFVDEAGQEITENTGYITYGHAAFLRVAAEPESGTESGTASGTESSDPMDIQVAYFRVVKTDAPEADGKVIRTGSFERVPVNEAGLYPVEKNGVYRVTASNMATGVTKLLFMDQIDPSLPILTLEEITDPDRLAALGVSRALSYSVEKGEDSRTPLTLISINGYELDMPENQTMVRGVFPIYFEGDYTLHAEDEAGNQQDKSLNAVNFPIDVSREGAFPYENAWNQAKNNGTIRYDLLQIKGGAYHMGDAAAEEAMNDPSVSHPEENVYVGSYKFASSPEKLAFVEKDTTTMSAGQKAIYTAKRNAYYGALTWTSGLNLSGLTPGRYVVYTKEAAKGTSLEGMVIKTVTIADRSVSATVKVAASTALIDADGGFTIMPSGGRSGSKQYEFAISDLILDNPYKALLPLDSDKLDWTSADDPYSTNQTKSFNSLRTGWYQIAVRDKSLDYSDSANYDNAYTTRVHVGYEPGDTNTKVGKETGPKNTSETGTTLKLKSLTDNKDYVSAVFEDELLPMALGAQADLIAENQFKDLIIEKGILHVRIPKGTLAEGDRIDEMLADTEGIVLDASSQIRFIDKAGRAQPVKLSSITPNRVAYVAAASGVYEVSANPVAFLDIRTNWAAQDIRFAAGHGLFAGISETEFAPDRSMTRGMFVTVLGRLEGIDPLKYPGSSFSDVEPGLWYSPYIRWAAENGIVGGFDDGTFAPEQEITREELCVMMDRFIDYAGYMPKETAKNSDFADEAMISSWADQAVIACSSYGLVNGISENRFAPQGESTRAQVAAILRRFIDNIIQ